MDNREQRFHARDVYPYTVYHEHGNSQGEVRGRSKHTNNREK